MTVTDDLVLVVELACLTADRDPVEQRALIATALRLDRERGKFTAKAIEQGTAHPPVLVDQVVATYGPEPDAGRPANLTTAQTAKLEKLREAWEPCETCGRPRGVHPADGCPP